MPSGQWKEATLPATVRLSDTGSTGQYIPSAQSRFVLVLGQNHPAGHASGALREARTAVLSPPTSTWHSVPKGHAVFVSDGLLVSATALTSMVMSPTVIAPPLADVWKFPDVTETLTLVAVADASTTPVAPFA